MTDRIELLSALDSLLQPERYKDYAPNGLQVEGRQSVRRLVSGVTASASLIEAAIAAHADAILVHHGLFWRGYDGRVTGWMRKRLGLLITNNVSLLAYHLPLDAHAELGNNAQLAKTLGWSIKGCFGDQQLGFLGTGLQGPYSNALALADHIEATLGRKVTLVSPSDKPIARLAWCTGGAQGYFEDAIASGVDAFITGEISEPQAHYARECGVAYLACGHHATERYGVQAVGAHVAAQLGISHSFIDIDNPA